MQRYVIERAIPDIGSAEREALKGAAAKSNEVLSAMQGEGKGIQWEHSYVASDKTVCIYVADNADLIAEHAERSGFPATTVTGGQQDHRPDNSQRLTRPGARF